MMLGTSGGTSTHGERTTSDMSEYTPTTALMREWHVRGDHAGNKSRAEYEAEFDRWLEAHDREVAAKALIDFADAHLDPDNWVLFSIDDAPVTIGDMICEAAFRIKEGGSND